MLAEKNHLNHKLFQIDTEYFTFISGALISIPLSLFFELSDNYSEITFWIALFSSLAASFFCFWLSIILKGVHEEYEANKQGIGDATMAWNRAIEKQGRKCVIILTLTFVLIIVAIVCSSIMQLVDTSSVAGVING